MMTLGRFQTPEEAHLVRIHLADLGLESAVLDEHMVQWFWQLTNALGGVRLSVEDDDREEAEEGYADYVAARMAESPIERTIRFWPLVVLLYFVIGVPMLVFGRRTCDAESGP